MILTITSLKGGTAKTTLTGLLALYLAQRCQKSVLLVDLDPQAGTTALFLDGKPAGPTVADLLQQWQAGLLTAELCRAAFQPSPYAPRIFVLAGEARLAQLATQDLPLEALRGALEAAAFPPDALFLVDTGTLGALVYLGISPGWYSGDLYGMIEDAEKVDDAVDRIFLGEFHFACQDFYSDEEYETVEHIVSTYSFILARRPLRI